jgi:DNA repair exonuclease SbcCD ATPase subunit
MRQKADLEAALEAYEGQAADDATASAAVKHASKEVRDLRQKLQSTSQTMRQLMEERDRLKDEVQSIKNERDMWLKTEYNVLRNDLYALEEENKQLKGVLHGAERAVGLLQALARFTRELANVLDCTEHSWTDEECQQGLAAYEELAKAWEAVREPLELALHGIPPGRSVFDRAYPDKRYREPRDKFLAQRAAGNGEAQSSQSGKRPPKRTQPDPALEIDDPDALEHEIQALEREWAASSSPEDDADD